ncbi:MAG: extracellular solute-binding protein [Erysipelotrichaceae bacterium]|nr:extracellular solute-binding protein [Erysipelotrichaceae bacterium]
MKQTKTLTLLSLLAALPLFGCAKGGNQGDPHTIQIFAWDSGLGTEWLKEIVTDFNDSQTEYRAVLETNNSVSTITKTLGLGATGNPYDLYFCYLGSFEHYDDFLSLDDVYDSKADEKENMTIKEKLYDGFYNAAEDEEGNHKFMYYGNSATGIVYNRSMIKDEEVPVTTDELEALVTNLSAEGKTPWLFFNEPSGGSNGYWNYVSDAWATQYDGLDYHYNKLMMLEDDNGVSPSKAAFEKKDGRYQALKVMEKVLTPSTVHKQCTNTNFTTVQTLFLNGEAAMSINGAWLLNENKSSADVSMMKTPVISSIVETLEDKDMDDETLAKIVREVDEGKTESNLCSAKDFARIQEARGVIVNNAAEQYIFAPSYSNAIEGTKAFLRFYSRDEEILRYINTLHLPATSHLTDDSKIDMSSYPVWNKQAFAIANAGKPVLLPVRRSPVFRQYSMNIMNNVVTSQSFIASNPKDRRNADQVWDTFITSVEEHWKDWTEQ